MATLTNLVLDRGGAGAALRRVRPGLPASPARAFDLHAATCDDLAAASAGWDVRYVQQASGRWRARHVGLRTESLHVMVESWSLGTVKRGRGPRGWVTFLVPAGGVAARIQGAPVSPGDVAVFLDGDEFDYRTAGPARLVSVGVERRLLERHVRELCGRCLGELRLQGRLSGLRTDPAALRRACQDLAAGATWGPRRALEDSIARRLTKALMGRFETVCAPRVPSRGRALALRAEAWLRQNLAEPPTIAALCAALQASERTLHEAFREHLETTPKAYVKALRLNAARRELLSGRTGRRVTDVALDWGFLHFGWFSQDYRRLFGETPSQSLHRARLQTASEAAAAGGR